MGSTGGWAATAAVILTAAVVLGGGCRQNAPQRPREVRIAEAVAEKLATWRARRRNECYREALDDAQVLADSLVMDYAFAKRLELARPSRPIRPEEPPLLRPDDSLSMDPFRGDSLIRAGELPRRRPRVAAPAPAPPRDSTAGAAPRDSVPGPRDSVPDTATDALPQRTELPDR